ncbi:MAG: alanine racemase [Bdellovibrionales bacterium]|nr:alanine racemase [Bdellovibrionales bacterium]
MNIEKLRRTHARINLSALRSNLVQLKSLQSENAFFCPMVKANAYGHGAVEACRICADVGVSAVGVALYSEAEELREAGVELPILVFEPGSRFPYERIRQLRLIPVVSSLSDLERMHKEKLTIHLKFNTGMNRLGIHWTDTARLKVVLASSPGLSVAGVCSHLSHGDDVGLEGGQSSKQIPRFKRLCEEFSSLTSCFHLWNSAGLLAAHGRECSELVAQNWGSRPGISVYGGYTQLSVAEPKVRDFVEALEFQNVMTLKGHVTQANRVRKGSIVSYGGTWKAERDSIIAVLSLGYADGYPRHLSNRAFVTWQGFKLPVVGRVCMDYTMVDVTSAVNDPAEIEGEDVVVYGSRLADEPTAEECADVINTISYELFTSVSSRVPRVYERALDATSLEVDL